MALRVEKENIFNLNELTMRELQTFLIILQHDGERLSILKKYIDIEFKHRSRTKGYDYINMLCHKGLVNKKKVKIKGKNTLRIFIPQNIRKKYEKLILPTLSSIKEITKEYMDDYSKEVSDTEIIREKFRNYTDSLKNSIIKVLKNSPIKQKENKQLQKKVLQEFDNNLKVELVKYQLFSK